MNAVFLLSGGLDSQVLLATQRHSYAHAHCVGFDYFQRHARELQHAAQIARFYGATWEAVSLPKIHGSALTGASLVPKGLDYRDGGENPCGECGACVERREVLS